MTVTAAQHARQALVASARAFAKSEGQSMDAAYDWVTSRTEEGRWLLSIALDDRADRSVPSYLTTLRHAEEWERWAAAKRFLAPAP